MEPAKIKKAIEIYQIVRDFVVFLAVMMWIVWMFF